MEPLPPHEAEPGLFGLSSSDVEKKCVELSDHSRPDRKRVDAASHWFPVFTGKGTGVRRNHVVSTQVLLQKDSLQPLYISFFPKQRK